jgi:hypothetical protein
MVSKFLPVFFVILFSCSKAAENGSTGSIGSRISDQAGLYNAYGIETSTLFVVDQATDRLLRVSLGDFSIKQEIELKEKNSEHYVAMDINEKFAIDFSKKHLNIYGVDGGVYQKPFSFQGTPKSVAYNPYTRTMIMQDNLQSVGIMKLAENGAISKSWLGGPQLSQGKSIIAGDLDKSGRLALAMSDATMSVVDIDQTIEKQSWQSVDFSPSLGILNWIAPDHRNQDLVLCTSSTVIAIVNVATKTVLEQKTIESSAIIQFQSKAGRPHVFTLSAGGVSLYFINANGALEVESLAQTSLAGLKQSYLDADGAHVTMLFQNGYQERSVIRMRLSDALVMVVKSIDTNGDTSIGANKMFVNYHDPLGALELHSLETDVVQKLEGYNFDYLRVRN